MAGNLNVLINDKDFEMLKKNIDNFDKSLQKNLEKGVLGGARIIAEDIKQDIRAKAKKQTGQLESSVGYRIFSSHPGYVNADAGYVYTDPGTWSKKKDRYFVYWEIGTSRQAPRHSALNAKNKMKKAVKVVMEEAIFEALNGIKFG